MGSEAPEARDRDVNSRRNDEVRVEERVDAEYDQRSVVEYGGAGNGDVVEGDGAGGIGCGDDQGVTGGQGGDSGGVGERAEGFEGEGEGGEVEVEEGEGGLAGGGEG